MCFVLWACHSHNYPNLEQLRICNVLCQHWRRQSWLNTHFIPVTPLHISSNAINKDTWGEWQGLGKLNHKTLTFLNLLYILGNGKIIVKCFKWNACREETIFSDFRITLLKLKTTKQCSFIYNYCLKKETCESWSWCLQANFQICSYVKQLVFSRM